MVQKTALKAIIKIAKIVFPAEFNLLADCKDFASFIFLRYRKCHCQTYAQGKQRMKNLIMYPTIYMITS